jgi:hypothetical protein
MHMHTRQTLLIADKLNVLLERGLVPLDASLAAKHYVHFRRAENLLPPPNHINTQQGFV